LQRKENSGKATYAASIFYISAAENAYPVSGIYVK